MNGIHDMGGLHGFGPVVVENDEPVFHQWWESRVFGVVQSLSGPDRNIDSGRHSIERLDPVSYLKDGYFGRWFASLERTLVGLGVVAPGEIEARVRARRSRRRKARSRKPVAWRPLPRSYARPREAPPVFAPGQQVRARNYQPTGHTRLPAYVRGHVGVVVRQRAAMIYPDDHAHHRGENPQYLYTVRFDGPVLWGDAAEPGTSVYIDLFEPYLERA